MCWYIPLLARQDNTNIIPRTKSYDNLFSPPKRRGAWALWSNFWKKFYNKLRLSLNRPSGVIKYRIDETNQKTIIISCELKTPSSRSGRYLVPSSFELWNSARSTFGHPLDCLSWHTRFATLFVSKWLKTAELNQIEVFNDGIARVAIRTRRTIGLTRLTAVILIL